MKFRLLTLAAISSAPLLFTANAGATPLSGANTIGAAPAIQVRMVCNEYGRCWERADNPGEAIARGVLGAMDGRSGYRHDRDDYRYRGHRGRRHWDEDDD